MNVGVYGGLVRPRHYVGQAAPLTCGFGKVASSFNALDENGKPFAPFCTDASWLSVVKMGAPLLAPVAVGVGVILLGAAWYWVLASVLVVGFPLAFYVDAMVNPGSLM